MPFDPATRKETWWFVRIRRGKQSPILHRLPLITTEYDGDPTQYIEPVPVSDFYHIDTHTAKILNPFSDGARRVSGIEVVDETTPLFEGLHRF